MTPPRPPYLLVSMHDVTPAHAKAVREALDLLDDIGVQGVSLLAVPEYHGTHLGESSSFVEWLHRRGRWSDEIVLHGWRHIEHERPKGLMRNLRRTFLTRGEGEFLGIERETCSDLVGKGLARLNSLALEAQGFVAPAWLIEPALYPVLHEAGMRYTTRQMSVIDLKHNLKIGAPTIVLRGSSKLMSKLSRFSNNLWKQFLTGHPVLRVAVHPVDMAHGAQSWYRNFLGALLKQRTTLTYSGLFEALDTDSTIRGECMITRLDSNS
jgi:uncharacterized protein